MKQADMTTVDTSTQSVDEAIADYLKEFSGLRKAKDYEAAVSLQNKFSEYIFTLPNDSDREKAAEALVHSI